MKRTNIALFFVAVLFQRTLAAECAPKKLLRIVTQAEAPEIRRGSFASLPKTVYRLGTKFARVEEEPDPENKIHGLIISNAPDNWLINLYDRTGQHVVDPDPHGKIVAPLFPPGSFEGFPDELTGIEMGCEVAFFASHGSPLRVLKTARGERVQQTLGIGDWRLVLIRRTSADPPELLFVFNGNDLVYTLRYLAFEEVEEPDMRLFAKPEGIAFKEIAPE